MGKEKSDQPTKYGVRLSDEVMRRVEEILEYRRRTQQACTLSAVVSDAIDAYHELLMRQGVVNDK